MYYIYIYIHIYIYIYIWGTNHGSKQHAGKKGSPLLSEEVQVAYQIALIRCSQGGLDTWGEKVIWKLFTENDCNAFTDLKSKS